MARILLIEDDVNSAIITQRVLMRAGHDVVHAPDGLTGLSIASSEQLDLVLLDLGLPDIGGHTIAALIKRIPGHINVVAVTASTDERTHRRALGYGCAGYLTKPINTRTFADEIMEYLALREDAAIDEAEQEQEPGDSVSPIF